MPVHNSNLRALAYLVAGAALLLPCWSQLAAAETESDNEGGSSGVNLPFGHGVGSDVLLLTILAIVGVSGYAGYKLVSIKLKSRALRSKAANNKNSNATSA